MSVLKTDLTNAVYALSGNKMHDSIIELVFDMHEGRDYHNLDHVEYCLREAYHHFDETNLSDAQKNMVIIAICFHDIFQDLTNPVKAITDSVELMHESLIDVLTESDIKFIRDLIKSTGIKAPITEAQQFMHDCDYAILGSSNWDVYKAYSKGVETEAIAQGIDKTHFNKKRIAWLRTLRSMSNIFLLEYFGKNYEWRARNNIIREILLRQNGGILMSEMRTQIYCCLCRKWMDCFEGTEEEYRKSRTSTYCSLCKTGYQYCNETLTLTAPKGTLFPYQLKEKE